MAIVAIAFCWAHKVGEWQHEIKPINIKKHGRKAISLFHYGTNQLRNAFCGIKHSSEEMLKLTHILIAPPLPAAITQLESIL